MKNLIIIMLTIISLNCSAQIAPLIDSSSQCENLVVKSKYKGIEVYKMDCRYSQWNVPCNTSKFYGISGEKFQYKGHLFYKIDKGFSFGVHSIDCPLCYNCRYSMRNIQELSMSSYQCESYVKEFSYGKHIICRVNCSGNYWGFHAPNCPGCN